MYFEEINYMLHWKGIFYILFVIILRSAQENKNSVQQKIMMRFGDFRNLQHIISQQNQIQFPLGCLETR